MSPAPEDKPNLAQSLPEGDFVTELLKVEAPDWLDADDPRVLIDRVNELSRSTLYNAIKRARILQHLQTEFRMGWEQYVQKAGLQIKKQTYYHLLHVLNCPRLARTDWQKPNSWTVYRDISYFEDDVFEGVKDKIFPEIRRPQVKLLRRSYNASHRPAHVADPSFGVLPAEWHDQVVGGDCFDLLRELPAQCIDVIVTGPPYADAQMFGEVRSPIAKDYPGWYLYFLDLAARILKPHGSIISVINSTIQQGTWVNYIERIIIAAEDAGWKRPDKLDWFRPDGVPPRLNDTFVWISRIHPLAYQEREPIRLES
jgi:hypothetical protein